MIVGRCNNCFNALGNCTCRGFKPLEFLSVRSNIKQKKKLNN